MKKISVKLFLATIISLLQSCAHFSDGSRSDFAIPNCEKAWINIADAKVINDFKTLIVNDCSIMYQQGWRLPINDNRGGKDIGDLCDPAFAKITEAGQISNAKFMVTHNCPVFYRKHWIVPPA